MAESLQLRHMVQALSLGLSTDPWETPRDQTCPNGPNIGPGGKRQLQCLIDRENLDENAGVPTLFLLMNSSIQHKFQC